MDTEKYTFDAAEMKILRTWYEFVCKTSFAGAGDCDHALADALKLDEKVDGRVAVGFSRKQLIDLAYWYDQADCDDLCEEIKGSHALADKLRLLPRLYTESDLRVARGVQTDLVVRGCGAELYAAVESGEREA